MHNIGCVGIIWFAFWMYLGFSSPATHPRISDAERRYIESSIAQDKVKKGNGKVLSLVVTNYTHLTLYNII